MSDIRIWEKDNKKMVRVPGGEFLVSTQTSGSSQRTKKQYLPEFWIDKTPVTNAEYALFVAEANHKPPAHWVSQVPPAAFFRHPVVNVSWHDARAYAAWAGKYLPSEQQWEKAARGTDGRSYPWGNKLPAANLCNFDNQIKETTPVGYYSPAGDSPYGCVDMCGNVWEWVDRSFLKIFYGQKGGSWESPLPLLSISRRDWDISSGPFTINAVGFRLAADAPA